MSVTFINKLLELDEVRHALRALDEHRETFNHEYINALPLSHDETLTKHKQALRDNAVMSTASLRFEGRSNVDPVREFDGEIQLYLKRFHWEQGHPRIEAKLFARATSANKTVNLFESNEQGDDCYLAFGSTVEEALKIAAQRMRSAFNRAEYIL